MMRTAEDLLQELAALDESHRIEAKQARQIDRSVMETICAFANEPGLGGGYLLLGVQRDAQDLFDHAYRVDGVSDPDKLPAAASSAAELAATTHPPDPDSHQPGSNSHQPNQDSHHLLATIPPQLAERIPSAGSKPRRDILRALIIDLCRWHALSARELAGILHRRDHKPLVRDYLTPMVSEGLLAYTIPKMENHPDQRYTVSAETLQSD